MSEAPSRWNIIAAFAAIYLIWGSTYLGISFAIETIPPFLMAASRFLIAGGILYTWMRLTGAPRPALHHWKTMAIIGGLLLMGGNGLVTWAEQHVPSSLAALIIGATPVWFALVDWIAFGGRRPGGRMAAGLVLGLAGVALLVGPADLAGGDHVDPLGAGALMLASMCWATGSLYSRGARMPDPPALATGMEMLAGGVLLLIAGTINGDWAHLDISAISLKSALALLYLALFGSLVAFSAYIWLLRHTTATRASTYAYVNPVVALFLGWALAGEEITPRTLAAAAIIVGAVVVITTYHPQPDPKPVPAAEPCDDCAPA